MGSQTKESELLVSFFLYVAKCRETGDERALRESGLGPEELKTIERFQSTDLARIGQLRAHCLRIHLDQEAFWLMVAALKSRSDADTLRDQLIEADAPAEMLKALLGIDPNEYARRCRELGVTPSTGRPAESDEEAEQRLWKVWEAQGKRTDLTGQDYLDLADQADVPMRAVWRLMARWQEEFLEE